MSESKSCAVCDKALPHDNRYEINTANNCIRSLADRIAKLEAQLGAADRKSLVTTAQPVADGTGATAAPSVPPYPDWSETAEMHREHGWFDAARACEFAALIVEWYKRQHRDDADDADLYDLVGMFVRGEKLPEVK